MSKILLVEDDHFLSQLYKDLLTTGGYSFDYAAEGEEAYEKIKKGGYDLVLLDIMLPKMDGLEIMRRLKKEQPANPNKKVVFLTNLDQDSQLKEAKELGNGYMVKSDLTPESFLEKVKEYLK